MSHVFVRHSGGWDFAARPTLPIPSPPARRAEAGTRKRKKRPEQLLNNVRVGEPLVNVSVVALRRSRGCW
jgi:hypothetical protein